MNIENIYQKLTQVNIEEQRRIWDERGKGYYGEFCVFKELFLKIKGNCKFLMNLHIPSIDKTTTELDLIMIHETGIFVFEIKHYKGTIYGSTDDSIWTQFFRTTKNSTFDSPVHQNGYHIRALKNMFPSCPMHSVIVFSNEECDIRVTNDNPFLLICSLSDLISKLNHHIDKQPSALTAEEIERTFTRLMEYSPIGSDTDCSYEGEILPFHQYVNQISIASRIAIKKAQDEAIVKVLASEERSMLAIKEAKERSDRLAKYERKRKVRWWASLGCAVAILVVIVLGIYSDCASQVSAAKLELEQMKQNFEHVDVYNGGHLDFKADFIDVTDVQLTPSKDLDNTLVFTCTIKNTGEDYGIMFTKNTKYIIMLKDGTVKEYDMFGERLQYYEGSQKIGGSKSGKWYNQSGTLVPLEIYDIANRSDIQWIKLNNIAIWKYGVNSNKSIAEGYQILVYGNA